MIFLKIQDFIKKKSPTSHYLYITKEKSLTSYYFYIIKYK